MSHNCGGLDSGMARQQRSFELTLPPRAPNVPSYHWLRDTLRSEILRGGLKPGQRIPATRDFARQYGLSRGTVLAAIDDLRSEGYLYGLRGSGTFISKALPERFLQTRAVATSPVVRATKPLPRISDYAQRVEPFRHFIAPTSRAFRTNLPALELFPTALWAQVASRRLRRLTSRQLVGCDPAGYEPLRHAVTHYLSSSRGVRCDVNQVVIVSGVQEALDLVARLLLNPGDRVLIEDPGYQVAYGAFQAAGAKLVPVAIDEEGAAPQKQDFRNARLMYVTPGHQFPTGVTMPFTRRVDILHHAHEAGAFIFEDDHDSEYRYSGSPLPAMQGLDRNGIVMFAGSFNKVLFPSLRMGYMVLPPSLVDVFARTKALVSRHHSVIDQAVVCDFIELGHFGRHLRRTRKVYAERLGALSHYARKHLAGFLELSKIEAGLQTVGWLVPGINAEAVSLAAADRNVDVVALSRYRHKVDGPEGLQIGFAAVDEAAIEAGAKGLADALKAVAGSSPKKGGAAKNSPA